MSACLGNSQPCSINETLKVAVFVSAPLVSQKPDWRNLHNNDQFEGFFVDMFLEIASLCNFSFVFVTHKDTKYGTINENGTWDGAIGDVARGTYDMVASPMRVQLQRLNVVDFSMPLYFDGLSILLQKSGAVQPSLLAFLEPLSPIVWCCVGAAFVVLSLTLWSITALAHTGNKEQTRQSITLLDCAWAMLSLFLAQGPTLQPSTLSIRILNATWCFFGIILFASYTGNLAAFLTLRIATTSITSFDDLVKQTQLEYGTVQSSAMSDFFQHSTMTTYQKMWTYMSKKRDTMVLSDAMGVQKVKMGGYAFISATLSLQAAVAQNCSLIMIGEHIAPVPYGLIVRRGWPHKKQLDRAIVFMHEKGRIAELRERFLTNLAAAAEPCGYQKQENALNIDNVAGLFVVLTCGVCLAVVVAILEKLYLSYRKISK